MKHILWDNALEAWAVAIHYCDDIVDGRATLKYRKNFISCLHNATELFIKQYMLDINDYRVCKIYSKVKADVDRLLQCSYENAQELNGFFDGLSQEELEKFHSAPYNKLIEYVKELFREYFKKHKDNKEVVNRALILLESLRNDETHFMVDKWEYMNEKEFQELYNFMTIFYEILHQYSLLPFWGEAFEEYKQFDFTREKLYDFSYKKALINSDILDELRDDFEKSIPVPYISYYAFEITNTIVNWIDQKRNESFDELWTCIEMLLHYDTGNVGECSRNPKKKRRTIYNSILWRFLCIQ